VRVVMDWLAAVAAEHLAGGTQPVLFAAAAPAGAA